MYRYYVIRRQSHRTLEGASLKLIQALFASKWMFENEQKQGGLVKKFQWLTVKIS